MFAQTPQPLSSTLYTQKLLRHTRQKNQSYKANQKLIQHLYSKNIKVQSQNRDFLFEDIFSLFSYLNEGTTYNRNKIMKDTLFIFKTTGNWGRIDKDLCFLNTSFSLVNEIEKNLLNPNYTEIIAKILCNVFKFSLKVYHLLPGDQLTSYYLAQSDCALAKVRVAMLYTKNGLVFTLLDKSNFKKNQKLSSLSFKNYQKTVLSKLEELERKIEFKDEEKTTNDQPDTQFQSNLIIQHSLLFNDVFHNKPIKNALLLITNLILKSKQIRYFKKGESKKKNCDSYDTEYEGDSYSTDDESKSNNSTFSVNYEKQLKKVFYFTKGCIRPKIASPTKPLPSPMLFPDKTVSSTKKPFSLSSLIASKQRGIRSIVKPRKTSNFNLIEKSNNKSTGKLKFFNDTKKFGFLIKKSKKEVFFHLTDMEEAGISSDKLKSTKNLEFRFKEVLYKGKLGDSRKAVEIELI